DGYDIADYYNILETYGTLDDFKDLVAAAHRRGLRVITDLVMNHTSDQHPWFQRARSSREDPYHDYYVWSETDQKYAEARIIFLDVLTSNWTWDDTLKLYYWHRFYPEQPDLNYDNPAVRAAMLDVMKHWLDLGVDGFRADAVPYLFEREGTNCENLPETHAYLKEVRATMDARYQDRILLGEANQWPEDVRPYFGAGDELHMNFHFPLMPRIYMALRQHDRAPLMWVYEQTPPIPDNCQWCTFLRNHDELTLEMVTPEEREWMWDQYAPDARMRLNLGIRRRLAPLLDNDPARIRLANSLLFTLPGAPIIYYGDEIGMGDDVWLPDRNGVRTPMQWAASEPNAGFSTAGPDRLYAPVIASEDFNAKRVNVADQHADPNSMLNFMRKLVRLRKENPVLAGGDLLWLASSQPAVAAFFREDERSSLLAVHNLSSETLDVEIQTAGRTGGLKDQLGSGEVKVEDGVLRLRLEPYATRWYQ
ncbi:MAG TPA: maltose alpha-D-glucosyltransferase, partial [Anaerolineaceae bacterium]|nr:maltose alpha-D-glucosyltransferase [Anaerolineaceae bacterium]